MLVLGRGPPEVRHQKSDQATTQRPALVLARCLDCVRRRYTCFHYQIKAAAVAHGPGVLLAVMPPLAARARDALGGSSAAGGDAAVDQQVDGGVAVRR